MRKLSVYYSIVLLSAALLACSCEKTLHYEVDTTDGQLLILSRLSTEDSVHAVYAAMSYPDRLEPLPGATVTCKVNGASFRAAEVDLEADRSPYERPYEYSLYQFEAPLKAGDRIRVEVTGGSRTAWSEITVPRAPEPAPTDTLTTVELVESFWSDTMREVDYMHFTSTIRDIPQEKTWYVLNLSVSMDQVFRYTEEGKEDVRSSDRWDLSYRTDNDAVLEDGLASGLDIESLGDLFQASNKMRSFSDVLFTDRQASVRYFVPGFWRDLRWMAQNGPSDAPLVDAQARIHVRLGTISRDYYNYLRALNNLETFGYDVSPILEPVTLPSNVEGGLGMVSAVSETVYTIDLPPFTVERTIYAYE